MGNFKLTREVEKLNREVVQQTTFGDTWYVDYRSGLDTNSGQSKTAAFKTLSAAYAAAASNNNDVINIDGDSTVVETAMITWAKNRITVICKESYARTIQQSAKIQLGVTVAATDLAPILVTGTRNAFIGLKVINANTIAQSLYGFIDNGEGTYLENFMSVVTGNIGRAGHAHFWMAGDALTAKNVTFGHSTIVSTAAGYGILIDAKTGGAANVKECFLENVIINMSVATAAVATSCFIKIADNSAMNFVNAIDGLRGYHFIPSGQTIMTDAIIAAASTTAGVLDISNAVFFGVTGVGGGAGYGVNIAANSVDAVADGGLATALTD